MISTQEPYYYILDGNIINLRGNIIDEKIKDPSLNSNRVKLKIPALDSYRFYRHRNCDFNQITKKCLERIRQTHKTVRLLYSGGVDSHFMLRQLINNGIFVDEIHSVNKVPFNDPVCRLMDESESCGWIFLDEPHTTERLTGTKIFKTDLTEQHYSDYFNSDNFWKYSNNNLADCTSSANLVGALKLSVGPEICNLIGISTPFIYYNNGWKFVLVDTQFETEHSSSTVYKNAVHNISLTYPEFIEGYVNNIVDHLETFPDFKERFTFNKVINYTTSQDFRKYCPEMIETNGTLWGNRQPKRTNLVLDGDELPYQRVIKTHFKSLLWSPHLEKNNTQWYFNWRDRTDWNWVEEKKRFGGILSSEFSLD